MSHSPTSAPDPNALLWIDLEMTGLSPEKDRIIEIATIVTDASLNVIAEGPVIAVRQPTAALDGMDDWNKRTHGATGLIERVKASTIDAHPCAATAFARIGASWRVTCRRWKRGSTTAISMSAL
jgi:oligoribonuclease